MPPSRMIVDGLPDQARLRVLRVDLEVTAGHPTGFLYRESRCGRVRLSSMIPALRVPAPRLARMQLLFDFLPVIAFFVAYKLSATSSSPPACSSSP